LCRLRIFGRHAGDGPNHPARKRHPPSIEPSTGWATPVERAFCRIATRYDKLPTNYAAAIALAILVIGAVGFPVLARVLGERSRRKAANTASNSLGPSGDYSYPR
jgi:hypothetical protein